MLDILQTHMNEIQVPVKSARSGTRRQEDPKASNSKPRKLGFGLGIARHREGGGSDTNKIELALDIKSSKSFGNLKLPKVKSNTTTGV